MFVMQLIYHRKVGFLRWKIVTAKFGGDICAAEVGEFGSALLWQNPLHAHNSLRHHCGHRELPR